MRESMFIYFLVRKLFTYGLVEGMRRNILLVKTWGIKALIEDQFVDFARLCLGTYANKMWDNTAQVLYTQSYTILWKFKIKSV